MKTAKYLLAVITIPALAFAIFAAGRWHKQEFAHVPDKRMCIDGRDTKNGALVKWPQKGTATIFCPKFVIMFEGVSWSEISLVKAHYKVDGRMGGMFYEKWTPDHNEMGNGVNYDYSEQKREALITFQKHRFTYCDYRNTLNADGKEYSTAEAPVQLWVSRQGKISRTG